MVFKYLYLAFFLAVSFALWGCNTYKMSVLEGEFDAQVAPAMRGAEFAMEEHTSLRRLSVSVHPMTDKRIDLVNVWNEQACVCEGEDCCESEYGYKLNKSRADIDYILKSFPVSIDFEWMNKFDFTYTSYGFGLDPLPYAKFAVGVNFRYGEIGASAFVGLDYGRENYTYEGISREFHGFTSGYSLDSVKSQNSERYVHARAGFGGYASLFLGPVALVYAPSITEPWIWHDALNNYDISFEFPWLITNYIGVTYTLNRVAQFRAGVSIVNGKQLADRVYYGSASASWLF